mgnify:CR=1 FL=1
MQVMHIPLSQVKHLSGQETQSELTKDKPEAQEAH